MWAEIAYTHARGGVGRRHTRARVVYRPTRGGLIAPDLEIEKALRESGAEVSRGSEVDATEPQDLIVVTEPAASESNIAKAFEAAARYSRHLPVVTLAIDTPRTFQIPHANEIKVLSGLGRIALFQVDRGDFDPRAILQRQLEEYFAWSKSGRRAESRPIFFPERPRARENFLELVKIAPATPEKSRLFATAVARDLFDAGDEMNDAIAALIDAFASPEPRDLLSASVSRAASDDLSTIFSDRSSLGLGDAWDDEEPEPEAEPSRDTVARFDTPLPPGIEIAPRVNYYEFDVVVEKEIDPATLAKTRREVVRNCRPVSEGSLRALVDLAPDEWKKRGVFVGGEPLITEAAVARYEADPHATGTEIVEVDDAGAVVKRTIVDQTHHWSGKFGYAPAALQQRLPKSVQGAFANVDIVSETGQILLTRIVRAGEFLTFDYGVDFFGENAHPRFFLENLATGKALVGTSGTRDVLLDVVDVMMSHAWSAERAEALGMVEIFAEFAARHLLPGGESVSSLPFWTCAASDAPGERAARARVEREIEAAEATVVREVSESAADAEMGARLAEIERRAVRADDPVALWNAARREWNEMSDYTNSLQFTDVVMYAQMQMLMELIDDEDARVMRPDYDAVGSLALPRIGVDYVMPYTATAVRRAAEEMKREQVETWKKLFRDSGVDPEKTVAWEEARAMAAEREKIMAEMDPAERESMRVFVNFWLGYNEFTAADPADPAKRELVYDLEELLKVRETEISQGEREREISEEKIAAMRERDERETEAAAERKRVHAEQKESREARRATERAEFDWLGAALSARRGSPDAPAFDLAARDSVLDLIHLLETSYRKMFDSLDRVARDRWLRWKKLAAEAYAAKPGGGWQTTAKHPKFVGDAIKVLREFEAYEMRRHPKKYRKALESAGLAMPERKKRKKERKARTSSPVSPAKPSAAASPAIRRAASPARTKAYSPEAVFGAAAKIITRARSDSIFFFYNTRGEGFVEQFAAIFRDAEVLHRPEPGSGGAGGAASPEDVDAKVTHFFVLHGGDEDAPRWYAQITRGIAGWPYLIATRESRDLVDPNAQAVEGTEFEMDGEKFAAWRRTEIVIELD